MAEKNIHIVVTFPLQFNALCKWLTEQGIPFQSWPEKRNIRLAEDQLKNLDKLEVNYRISNSLSDLPADERSRIKRASLKHAGAKLEK